jgi:hypothetical protein
MRCLWPILVSSRRQCRLFFIGQGLGPGSYNGKHLGNLAVVALFAEFVPKSLIFPEQVQGSAFVVEFEVVFVGYPDFSRIRSWGNNPGPVYLFDCSAGVCRHLIEGFVFDGAGLVNFDVVLKV